MYGIDTYVHNDNDIYDDSDNYCGQDDDTEKDEAQYFPGDESIANSAGGDLHTDMDISYGHIAKIDDNSFDTNTTVSSFEGSTSYKPVFLDNPSME